jgi:signal peptidase II
LLISKEKLLPFTLTFLVILLDQVSKMIVVALLPFARPVEVLGDFLRLTYVKNPAIAFSLGRDLPSGLRTIIFLVLPLIVLAILLYFFFSSSDFSRGQRWVLAAIIGGGVGNFIDRLFRSGGVVDFIDVKFYGIFGLERWPIFNIADSTVVVAGILLLLSYFIKEKEAKK